MYSVLGLFGHPKYMYSVLGLFGHPVYIKIDNSIDIKLCWRFLVKSIIYWVWVYELVKLEKDEVSRRRQTDKQRQFAKTNYILQQTYLEN